MDRRSHAAAVIFLLSPWLGFLNTPSARRLAWLSAPLGAVAGILVARRLARRTRPRQ